MDNLGMFLIAIVIIGLIAYAVIWSLATDYFLEVPNPDNFSVWRGVIWAAVFAVVVVLLSWYGYSSIYEHQEY